MRYGTICAAKGLDIALASLGAPPLLRGRRGTIYTAKGSDALASLGAPSRLRGGRAIMCIAKFSMVGVVQCQGNGCMPWRPLRLHFFCVVGVRLGTLPGFDVRSGVVWGSGAFA